MHKLATPPVAVVKYGGNAMQAGPRDAILADAGALLAEGWTVVIVHGGGPEIDAALEREGVPTERVAGLRVTSEAVLRTTEAALCATVNKRLVRECLALGIPAAGISGQDGALLTADPIGSIGGIDLGAVGVITGVNAGLAKALVKGGFVPVVAPLAVAPDGSRAFNVNADTAAGALAAAMHADVYINVSNVAYVLADAADPASRIERFSPDEAEDFLAEDACTAGMIPKLESAIAAVRAGVPRAVICGAREGALRAALAGGGTTIYAQNRRYAGGRTRS